MHNGKHKGMYNVRILSRVKMVLLDVMLFFSQMMSVKFIQLFCVVTLTFMLKSV